MDKLLSELHDIFEGLTFEHHRQLKIIIGLLDEPVDPAVAEGLIDLGLVVKVGDTYCGTPAGGYVSRLDTPMFRTRGPSRRGSAIYAMLRREERECLQMLRDDTLNDCEDGAVDELTQMELIESVNGVIRLTDEGRLVAQYC